MIRLKAAWMRQTVASCCLPGQKGARRVHPSRAAARSVTCLACLAHVRSRRLTRIEDMQSANRDQPQRQIFREARREPSVSAACDGARPCHAMALHGSRGSMAVAVQILRSAAAEEMATVDHGHSGCPAALLP